MDCGYRGGGGSGGRVVIVVGREMGYWSGRGTSVQKRLAIGPKAGTCGRVGWGITEV